MSKSGNRFKNDIKIDEKEFNENIRCIEKEIASKKQMPNDEANKINKKVFENMLIADFVIAFLFLVSLGSLNIETTPFITDLKVFSILFVVCTILMFEYSYRKENGNIFLHGLECFCLALFTILSTYFYTMYFRNFQFIVSIATLVASGYFILKSLIIFLRMRRKYFLGLNDINEIIKK